MDSYMSDTLPTSRIHTSNRYDVDLRIKFLNEVSDQESDFENTLYYWFISDPERWANRSPNDACDDFWSLCNDIKEHGIREPLRVAKTTPLYILEDQSISEKKLSGRHDFQLIDGAHRLAAAIYLGMEEVTVNLSRPFNQIYPDYSSFINRRIKYYQTQSESETV